MKCNKTEPEEPPDDGAMNEMTLPSRHNHVGFEVRTLAVWGRARYFSVTETSHIIESLRVSRGETFWRYPELYIN